MLEPQTVDLIKACLIVWAGWLGLCELFRPEKPAQLDLFREVDHDNKTE